MFNLDHTISVWRQKMAAGGIKDAAVLDELESHLREDVERQTCAGANEQLSFESAVRKIGQPQSLRTEFAKLGEINNLLSQIKNFLSTLAGVSNLTLATNMNTQNPNKNIEPAWATYLKSGTFALPAAVLWVFVAVFAFPKFNQVVRESGLAIPAMFQFGMALMALMRNYLLVLGGGVVLAVALLEWRSTMWPKYRRVAFGTGAFLLNLVVLIVLTTMFILALVAGPIVSHHAN